MPPFIPLPSTAEVCLVWTLAGQNVEVCVHVRRQTGTPTNSELADLATAAETWFASAPANNIFSNDMSLIETTARDVSQQFGQVVVNPVSPAVPGGNNNPSVPNNVTATVTKRSAYPGRSRRGRTYFPGVPIAYRSTAGTWNNIIMTALLASYANLIQGLEAVGGNLYDFVIPSKQENKVPLAVGNTWPLLTATMDEKMDSQRRRLPGRGR